MLDDSDITNDQIIALFTRPDRTINPFRLAEIRDKKIHPSVAPAVPEQVEAFKSAHGSKVSGRALFFDQAPLHSVNLANWFKLKEGSKNILQVEETDRVECKESLNFGQTSAYARTMAGLANASGGFLLFGVKDAGKKLKGIKPGKLNDYDPARLSQYLADHFSPVPLWEKGEFDIGGYTVGVIFVREAKSKPIICTRDAGSDLREADIYYRYPGETRRVRYGELAQILHEASRGNEELWGNVLSNIQAAGVENVAVLDTVKGEVTGHAGKFIIDEALIPKVSFVTEGSFSEVAGAATLKLVGDVEKVSLKTIDQVQTVVTKENIVDHDLLEDFIKQVSVDNPKLYLERLAHSHQKWLPAYFFIRQAGIKETEIAEFFDGVQHTRPKHLSDIKSRLTAKSLPSGSPSADSVEDAREELFTGTFVAATTEDECKRLTKVIRSLKVGEVDEDVVFPLLQAALREFGTTMEADIRYAAAYLDVIVHEQKITAKKAKARKRKKKK